jgi:hypothetical protein
VLRRTRLQPFSSVCTLMKPIGKPDAGNRPVRFDERGQETERCRMAQATAPVLDSTGWHNFDCRAMASRLSRNVWPICALSFLLVAHAIANEASRGLLGLSEQKRNEVWTKAMQEAGERCDAVNRTMFQGTQDGYDSWSVACKDGNSYAVLLPPMQTEPLKTLSCGELKALNAKQHRDATVECWKSFK